MIWVFPDTLFNPVTTGSTVTLNRSTVTAGYVYRRAGGAGNGLPSFGTLTTADLPAGALTILGTSGSLSLASASTLTMVGSGITCTLTGTTALPTMTLAAATPTVTSVDTTNGLYVAAGVLKLSATSSEAFGAIVCAGSMSATTALFSGSGTVTGNWLVGTNGTLTSAGVINFGGAATVGGNFIVTGGGTLTTAGAFTIAGGATISGASNIKSIQIPAAAAAGPPPLTLNSGTLTTTPVLGGIEFVGSDYYASIPPVVTTLEMATPTALGNIRNNFTGRNATKFTPTATMYVSQLGRWKIAGNSASHVVGVWDTSNNLLASVTLNLSSGSYASSAFAYATLSSVLVLGSTASFYLASVEASGGDQWYGDSGSSLTLSGATHNGPYYYDTSWNNDGLAPASFVGANLKYSTTDPSAGAAVREGVVLFDGAVNLTSGKVPVATTNGRLTDSSLTISGSTLTLNYSLASLAVLGTSTFTGNINANGTQNKLETLGLKSGANKSCGTVTLVAGTMTVANTRVTASSIIQLTPQIAGGTQGIISKGTVVAGTSFDIVSTSLLDTSTIGWQLTEPF